MKIKYIIGAIFVAGLVSSCDLDRTPLSALSPDTYFKSASDLQAFSNTFYTCLDVDYTEAADMYVTMNLYEELRDGRVIPASGSGWTFTDLRKFNTLLENLDKCETESTRKEYEGLAKFFRAYFYFNKVKRFGDVPWYDHQLASDDPDLYKARDSRELVMQNMIADIDVAIANLPSAKSPYRINKWTALALKARFCLFEGTYRKYHNISGYDHDASWYLQKAAEAAETFISTSPYTIHNTGKPNADYLEMFTTSTVSGSNIEDEVILAKNYNAAESVTHSSNYTSLVSTMDRFGMNKKIVASYLCTDGTRFTDKAGWQTMQFYEECQDRDPRLAQSIRTPGYHRIGETFAVAPDLAAAMTGYQYIKYVTGTDQDAYGCSDIDIILFRYAEVLLNFAEAKAELGTLTQDDLDKSINVLRKRAGMPDLKMEVANADPDPFLTNAEWGGYQNVSGSNKGVILEIRRERAIELCQEGFRYYDVMRWKEGNMFTKDQLGMYFPGVGDYDLDHDGEVDVCLYTGTKPSSKAGLILEVGKDIVLSNGTSGFVDPHKGEGKWNEERDYLYPIPTDERLLTNLALTQNPGWNDGL